MAAASHLTATVQVPTPQCAGPLDLIKRSAQPKAYGTCRRASKAAHTNDRPGARPTATTFTSAMQLLSRNLCCQRSQEALTASQTEDNRRRWGLSRTSAYQSC